MKKGSTRIKNRAVIQLDKAIWVGINMFNSEGGGMCDE